MRSRRRVIDITAVVITLGLLALVGLLGPGATLLAGSEHADGAVCPHDGDVNHDGRVTPVDALLVFRYFLGLGSLDACQQDRANVNHPTGSAVTPGDALCASSSTFSAWRLAWTLSPRSPMLAPIRPSAWRPRCSSTAAAPVTWAGSG